MKKITIITLIICLTLIFSCTGCNKSSDTTAGLLQEKNTDTPLKSQTYSFDDYDTFVSWISGEDGSPERKVEWGEDYIDYINEIKITTQNNTPLYIPYYGDKVVELRQKEGFSGITFMTSELHNLPWVWYFAQIGDEEIIIKVACLSQKDFERVDVQNASIAVKNFSRTAPNVDNFKSKNNYKSISEKSINFSGENISALYIEQENNSNVSLKFTYDKTMVIITGEATALNSDVLNSISLKEIEKK